jgi:hypothetical protein
VITGIDHLVVGVEDLEAATRSYSALGFTVTPGGRHPTSTHNALVIFSDGSYLELLAFNEPSPGHRWWPKIQAGGGIIDFCARTDDLEADTDAYRASGVTLERRPGARLRPDGREVRWVTSAPGGSAQGIAPFLIQDLTPRSERVAGDHTHPNGVTGVGTITVAVEDSAARGWFANLTRTPGLDVRRDDLAATGVRFFLGRHGVDLVRPAADAGPIVGWLRTRGPGPYEATLLTSAASRRGPLDEAKTLGARLALV